MKIWISMKDIRKVVIDMSRRHRSNVQNIEWNASNNVKKDRSLVTKIVVISIVLVIAIPILVACGWMWSAKATSGGKKTIEDLGKPKTATTYETNGRRTIEDLGTQSTETTQRKSGVHLERVDGGFQVISDMPSNKGQVIDTWHYEVLDFGAYYVSDNHPVYRYGTDVELEDAYSDGVFVG